MFKDSTVQICPPEIEGRDTLTRTVDGCTEFVTLNKVLQVPNVSASAGPDQFVCEPTGSIRLMADLPEMVTGQWTNPGNTGMIISDSDPNTEVMDLSEGTNLFIWSLSGPDDTCLDFSSDSVIVALPQPVVATNDLLNVSADETLDNFNTLDNDTHPENYDYTLLGSPALDGLEFERENGQLTGRITYTPSLETTSITFDYMICDASCPQMNCDTATVRITTQCNADLEEALSNTFTPNEDGINDLFDPLEDLRLASCFYSPDRVDLRIVNRWGEVVFERTNGYESWNGKTSSNGTTYPQGVYFFFLTLKDDDRMVKGAITLIR